ncbi:MAG: carboxypeptidase-like regulatory domain-containing protein [Crocinitomicaceae bacterium]
MKKYFILIFISLSVFSTFGQNQIIDAESKAPVSYAYIKSVNNLKGVISDYNGFFVLDLSFSALDTIVVSCLGYTQKKFLVRDINEKKTIELNQSMQDLSEVTVKAEKTKYQLKKLGVTKKPSKMMYADYVGIAKNGEERAAWIPNEYSVEGYLKNIHVFVTDLGFPDAHFRIHVFACDTFETKPDKELTTSNIIASATTGNEWVTIDMSNQHIRFGENGCFIGIEWFDSPKSKFHQDTVYNNGVTWRDGAWKDTVYSRIRKGNGAAIGGISQKYKFSKDKYWMKEDNHWQNKLDFVKSIMYTTGTEPDGTTYFRTPNNTYQAIMCINIDVSFPKNKIDLAFDEPKKSKLNKLENVKQDVFLYPQNNVHALFSSLVKAFENDDIIYVLKYLCVYKDDQLNEILSKVIDEENENFISDENKHTIVNHLKELQSKLDSAVLTKIEDKHFELSVDNETYNLIFDDGLWKMNPYSHGIFK